MSVIVNDHIDDFEKKTILDVVLVENFRSICLFEYFSHDFRHDAQDRFVFRG